MITKSRQVEKSPHRDVQSAALVVSLALSAYVISIALASPKYQWLCWIGFLPLFAVVRSLRPLPAALAGGLWGACLYLFAADGLTREAGVVAPAMGPSTGLLALLIVIPAVYVGLAARRGQAVGFKLVTLALGWTLVEVVLHFQNRFGPHDGLFTGSLAEGPHTHWLARLFGYICTALLVACANASLVSVLSGARIRFPVHRALPGLRHALGRLPSQVVLAMQSWTHRQAYPRAPPIPVSGGKLNLVGNAL